MGSTHADCCQLDSTKWPKPVRTSIRLSVSPKHKLGGHKHTLKGMSVHLRVSSDSPRTGANQTQLNGSHLELESHIFGETDTKRWG